MTASLKDELPYVAPQTRSPGSYALHQTICFRPKRPPFFN